MCPEVWGEECGCVWLNVHGGDVVRDLRKSSRLFGMLLIKHTVTTARNHVTRIVFMVSFNVGQPFPCVKDSTSL